MHLMIDLETLGTETRSVILSAGYCVFDPALYDPKDPKAILNSGHVFLDVEAQLYLRRTVSWNTIEWWMGQSEEARSQFFDELRRYDPSELFVILEALFGQYSFEGVWAHGSTFDITMLQTLAEDLDVKVPWDFRIIRDTRTLFATADAGTPHKPTVKHNAMEDAIAQALNVCHCFYHWGMINER